ncbi:MAG: Omp28-related outer membrane protein [Ignavibacteriales bacterium]|nr:Omp28-related outer membrane protein [Ignavibacteriales bacterium]
MKKIFTLSVFIVVFIINISAQSVITNPDQINAGLKRFPLFEEVTNAYCGPCAGSNPILNDFLAQMHDSVVAVTYHAWWPGVNDPMYQHNTQQNRDRIQFMKGNVNATPWLNVDGAIIDVWPFTASSLKGAYNNRLAVTSPLGLEVHHTRISTDSVEVRVKALLLPGLPAGTWKLRVYAVEHPINYTTAPGGNGETYFPHVFRKAIPGSAGELLPTTPGRYEFVYRYKFEPAWNDTNLYSIAVVQDDISKEVANAGSSKFNYTLPTSVETEESGLLPSAVTLYDNYPNPFNPSTTITYALPEETDVTLSVYNSWVNLLKFWIVDISLRETINWNLKLLNFLQEFIFSS